MGHKTLIDGVGYDITGGRFLDDGVGYSIQKGRTLVDGVGYDISFFDPKPVLNDNDWGTIRAASDEGLAASLWAAGDTKTISLNGTLKYLTLSNFSIDVFILGIDHNSALEGTNRIHFQIGKVKGVDVCLCDSNYDPGATTSNSGAFTMNTSGTNSGGWNNSHMRKTVLGNASTPASPAASTLLSCLPSDLRAVMKSVTKYSDNTGGGTYGPTSSYVTATTDYLWLPADFEANGDSSYSNKAEAAKQAQYEYYKAGNIRTRYKHNATSTAAVWWLRSVYPRGGTGFCCVSDNRYDGDEEDYYDNAYASCSLGVAPCFAV